MRQAGPELFRLNCMYLMIWFHFDIHLRAGWFIGGENWYGWGLRLGRGLATKCVFGMVILSGYFSSRLNLERLLWQWLTCVFYSHIWVRILEYLNIGTHFEWVYKWAPISMENWWFMTAYFQSSLLSPAIRLLANELTKRQYIICIAGIVFCRVMGGGGRKVYDIFTSKTGNFLGLIFIAVYFRKHGHSFTRLTLFCLMAGGTFVQIMGIEGHLTEVFAKFARETRIVDLIPWFGGQLYGYWVETAMSGFLAVFGFLFYQTLPISGSLGRSIRFLAAKSIGIYMVHAPIQPNVRRTVVRVMHTLYPFPWDRSSRSACFLGQCTMSVTQLIIGVVVDGYRELFFWMLNHVAGGITQSL
jgi:hypothetical protein